MVNQFGYVKEGKVFLNSFRNFPERAIGEVKDTEENAINYFVNRFSVIENRVNKLVTSIETAQNKGSFLMSLLHLKESVPMYDALGDFEVLLRKLENAEISLDGLILQNRAKNKEIKESLIEEARIAVENPDWKEATSSLTELNLKWIKTGKADKELDDELEIEFRDIFTDFYNRKKLFYEEIQELYVKRLEVYQTLLGQAREVLSRKAHPAELKPIQAAWKEVGNVPKVMLHPVIKEYKYIVKELVRHYKNLRGPEIDFSKWERLAVEIEKMIEAKDFLRPERIKEIQESWRKLGKLPPHKIDILHRFTAAVDKFFEVSYLENTMKRKHPGIELRSTREQLEVKINLMKEFIRREKMEIESFQENLDATIAQKLGADAELVIRKKLAFQTKRLDNKTKLLDELHFLLVNL
jgi:hypothetical protein